MSNVGGLGGGNYGNYGLDYGAGPSPEAIQYGNTLQSYCRQVGQAIAERYQELRSGNPSAEQRQQIESEIQTLIGNLNTAEGYANQCGLDDLAHEIDRLGGTASSAWNPLAGPNGQGGLPPYSQVLADKIVVEAPNGRSLDPINISRRLDQHPVYIYGQNPQLNLPASANASITQETVNGRTMYKVHVTFQPDGRVQDYYTNSKPTLNVQERSQVSGDSSLYNISTQTQRDAIEEFVGDEPDEVNGDETVWNTSDHVRYYFDSRRFVDADGLSNPNRVDIIRTNTLDLNFNNEDLYINRLADGQYDIQVKKDGKIIGHIRTENVQSLNLRGVPQTKIHYRDGVSRTTENPSPQNPPPIQDRTVPGGTTPGSENIETTGPVQIRTTSPEDKVFVVPINGQYIVTVARGGDLNNTYTYTVSGPPSAINIVANENQKIQPWSTGPAMEKVFVGQTELIEQLPQQPTPTRATENEYTNFTGQDSVIHLTSREQTSPSRTTGNQEFTVNHNDRNTEHRVNSTGVVNIRVPDANSRVHWSTQEDGSILVVVSRDGTSTTGQSYILSGPPSRINIIANENQRGLVSGDPALTSRIHIGPNAATQTETVNTEGLPNVIRNLMALIPGLTVEQMLTKIAEFFPEVNLDGRGGVTIEELQGAINQRLFPPNQPNEKLARLLLALDSNLSNSLRDANVPNNPLYGQRMTAVTQRTIQLLQSLYGNSVSAFPDSTMIPQYQRANLMRFNGQTLQLFGSGVDTALHNRRSHVSNNRGEVSVTFLDAGFGDISA